MYFHFVSYSLKKKSIINSYIYLALLQNFTVYTTIYWQTNWFSFCQGTRLLETICANNPLFLFKIPFEMVENYKKKLKKKCRKVFIPWTRASGEKGEERKKGWKKSSEEQTSNWLNGFHVVRTLRWHLHLTHKNLKCANDNFTPSVGAKSASEGGR